MQGDIIRSNDSTAPMWSRFLMVITADCDLAHAKHDKRVTCVPLLPAEQYLLEMQLPKQREKFVTREYGKLKRELDKLGAPKVTLLRLRSWLREEPLPEIVDSLQIRQSASEKVTSLLATIKMLDEPTADLETSIARMVEGLRLSDPSADTQSVRNSIIGALRSIYLQPPGDALFVGAIGPKLRDGYFVYLRHLEQVLEPDIGLKPTRRPSPYSRLARFNPTMTHAILQRFGMVFMSIGLPEEYEENRHIHSQLVGA